MSDESKDRLVAVLQHLFDKSDRIESLCERIISRLESVDRMEQRNADDVVAIKKHIGLDGEDRPNGTAE